METVTVSPKYQIVIPRRVREAMGIRPGQKVRMVLFDGRLELVPERDIREMRGHLRGMDTTVPREDDRY
jgi:AbrB family looped-hinge helix DNA binding protein